MSLFQHEIKLGKPAAGADFLKPNKNSNIIPLVLFDKIIGGGARIVLFAAEFYRLSSICFTILMPRPTLPSVLIREEKRPSFRGGRGYCNPKPR